ncbi:thiamine pyrophosphate-binding protein [Anaerocolumna jejuensis]|uniref:thiamine pyrophosphate-binding protein n=1 Tax=Anaerocolumna jejuensis TaxID=259063 RepID=UPI003F7CA2D8
MERVADYVIQKIYEQGIDQIFMITGRGILFLTDAVAKNPDLNGVSVYHEQGASYAAMAYAQQKDGMGACLVSTGCAATNAVTGALCAWQDNLPCIFISGQNMLSETTRYTGVPIRTYGSQEADIIDIVKPVTKYAVMLTDPKDVVFEMEKAIYLANEGRKGPVWIDIPLDVQNMRIEPEKLRHFVLPEKANLSKAVNDEILQVVKKLEAAERPVIFAGGGVRSAGATGWLKEFAEKVKIPVVFSAAAADTYGSGNKYAIGAVGSLGGSRAGNFTVQNADYIVAIGSKLCSQTIGSEPNKFARNAEIVVVDIDQKEHTKQGAIINKTICADAADFLRQLCALNINLNCEDWLEKCLHWKDIFSVKNETFVAEVNETGMMDLYYFADELSSRLNKNTTVITDAGFEELIIPSTIGFHDQQRCLFPAAQGAMGYAIPAIIGAYYAGCKDIVTVVGDGSIMMNIQEFLAIQAYRIPAKIFVINNNMYAVIRKRQKDLFRDRTIGNDPSDGVGCPDFEAIAKCFGFEYRKINTAKELGEHLDDVLQMKGTVLCEVVCTEEQKYFHSSYALNQNKKLVKRPIEDLSPFLERDLFLKEMIVEPIE